MNNKVKYPQISIIICIHNALEDVKECLSSLYAKKTINFDLIIVDDGSNKETKKFLSQFIKNKPVRLITHKESKGYTVSANEGLKAATGEFLLLLNSDTIVTKGWLEKLIECITTTPKTGIVGPLSNSAGWQTVPDMKDWLTNKLPKGIDLETMSSIVQSVSLKKFPKVPLVNGFCFMIKREVIHKIGYLDEARFPIGYGEEDDYCIRAGTVGYELRIADHCYIYHKKSKSFTLERRKQISRRAGHILREKHGASVVAEYVQKTRNNKDISTLRQRIKLKLDKNK
ncbi:glycosyl transferase family 2 [Clostridium aceticum]|uniref:Glycosyl transferase family 2 n=1 Tax=Clostridium aceticum TaxID=84022 RepID=A0A0G3W978_9CLOT|nr:glycosyltransferase family 2 protein [Clostridium aceticum]AKL95226.1 glycosyl transferase family 2 [Clostridium aceticum]